MNIRAADEDDAAAVSSLVRATAAAQLRDEFTDDGWLLFQRLLSEKTQLGLIRNKQFNYLLAISDADDNSVVGVLAIKENSHLFHFFVDPAWQGKGIGKQLWNHYLQGVELERAKKQKWFNTITVNASDFASSFYLKLGFTSKHPREIKNGVVSTPMIFTLK